MLEAQGICKSFGPLEVLKNVSLKVEKGEIVSIVGSSGAGKSTLLHILGTLDQPDSGEISMDGRSISSLKSKELAAFRNREIGFVFQFHHLLPEFSAVENVCIPAYIGGKGTGKTLARAKELLTDLGLGERFEHRPSELSGRGTATRGSCSSVDECSFCSDGR